jgi:FAD/FMN-containing dehydrogenase
MSSEVATTLQDLLVEIVGAGHVDSDPDTTAAYAVDGVMPCLTVRPGTQDEVAAVVAACHTARMAMVPWGGGTAIGMGNAPTSAPVVIRLDRLDRVVEFDAENLCVTVEAGMPLGRLQDLIATRQELLPLDPPEAGRVTLGGLVAANQSGPSRLLHGTARDWVLGLRVVLPDGERIRCGGRVIKNVSGYDMNKLFIRSFGTLGIVTEVTVKLLPMPVARAGVLGVFQGLSQAAAVVEKVLGSFLLPESLDLLDPAAQERLEPELHLNAPGAFLLAVGLAGSQATVDRQVRELEALIKAGGGRATSLLEADSVRAWAAICNGLGATSPGAGRTVCRLSVPIARTAEMMAAIRQRAASHSLAATVLAHAGSGILRATLQPPPGLPGERALAELASAIESLRKEAVAAGGSLVLEEAPSLLKRQVDAWGEPGSGFSVMRRIKNEFDPLGLFSPGRFVGGI